MSHTGIFDVRFLLLLLLGLPLGKGDRRWADTLARKGGVGIDRSRFETKQAPNAAFDAKEASTQHTPRRPTPHVYFDRIFCLSIDRRSGVAHTARSEPDRCERRSSLTVTDDRLRVDPCMYIHTCHGPARFDCDRPDLTLSTCKISGPSIDRDGSGHGVGR